MIITHFKEEKRGGINNGFMHMGEGYRKNWRENRERSWRVTFVLAFWMSVSLASFVLYL